MKINYIVNYITIVFVAIFTGCSADLAKPEIDFEPPKYVEQMPSRENETNYVATGSIFGQGDSPLFSDHKAMHVNDIVKVIISETAKSSSSAAKQLSKADNKSLGGGIFSTGGTNPAVRSYVNSLNGLTNVGFASNTNSTYKGQGSSTKDATFTTTISARIVKVLSNGNYFISGKREILVDDQKQIIQISGVIRPYDIDQSNTIYSTQMSDAKILYKTQGDVNRATTQGWASQIIDAIWPF